MLPATHPLNTLDRLAFSKSVREKRKQLQLNHQSNAAGMSMENTFLTQMLQSSSHRTLRAETTSSPVSPSLEETAPKLVRSASVKSCASDSGVSSSSPLSDNNIVHVCRKRKSLAYFYEGLNKDKKFSSEAFPTAMSTAHIPYSQQEAIAIGYAQYALMQSLTQQLRVNYPSAFLHAATGYFPIPSKASDTNNNHIRVSQDQPYRRETYQTLLESSQLLGQHKLRHSPSSSPSEAANEYVCIPKKLMPVIGARINDWLERNLQFVSSLSVVDETPDKLTLLSHVWHRLVLISMIENSFEIYVTADLQIGNELSLVSQTHPTETDVKQIESLISRGKTLDIDEIGFNLIREVIIYKEGKTLLGSLTADAFDKAECHAQARLTSWCSSRVKYSKIVFLLCNIYQVKQDIFERLFCASSLHQSTPIQTSLERFLRSSSTTSVGNA